MPPAPLWQSIRDTLAGELAAGHFAPGDRLPTEARLAARFGVNRHTVRRALADLAAGGHVVSRQGAGVFAAVPPADYPLGRRMRFHRSLRAAGRVPERRVLSLGRRAADAGEARALQIAPGDPVVVLEALALAEGLPIGLSHSVFPVDRLPGLEPALAGGATVSEALAAAGVPDFLRAETRISAEPASTAQAALLRVKPGAALLCTRSRDVTPKGRPVETGTTWFAGDRLVLTLKGECT